MSSALNITLKPETSHHQEARDALIRECFAAPQPERAAFRLRKHVAPDARYSTVALDDQILMGSIRFSPLLLPNGEQVLMLGPLAISPMLRGHHIGKRLVAHGLSQLQADQEKGVIVIGDAGYFTPLGFSAKLAENFTPPGIVAPLSLMGIEWQAGFLSEQSGALVAIKALSL